MHRYVATAAMVALIAIAGADAAARSGNTNGWSAGGSSNEISGHVGSTRPGGSGGGGGGRGKPSRCTRARGCGSSRGRPAPPPTEPSSADALKTVRLPPPVIAANPTPAGLAGLESRFWATVPERFVQDLAAGDITTHLEARPAALLWNFGDGAVGSTPPGERPQPDAQAPAGGAANTYERADIFRVNCRVEWAVTWQSSDGSSGSVEGRQSESQIDYRVVELRSVLTG